MRLLLLLLLGLCGLPIHAQDVRPMADLNTGPNRELSGGMGNQARFFDGRTVFVYTDPVHGTELWVTDGTAPNTRLLADLCPGRCASAPAHLHVEGSNLFFAADDGVHGSELWRLPAGSDVPVMVADINPGADGSSPADFLRRQYRINDSLVTRTLFVATRRAEGRELWRLSGLTPTLERDIVPGPTSSDPRTPLILGNGGPGVTAVTPNLGRELYALGYTSATDPAAASATPIGGFNLSPNRRLRSEVLTLGTRTFAVVDDLGTASDDLYVTDGTTAGTLKLRSAGGIGALTANVGLARVFHTVRNGSVETLAVSDGSVAGSINLSSANLAPRAITVLGSRVYFAGLTASGGRELMVSDGTAAGTSLFKELVPGSAGMPEDVIGRPSANGLRAYFAFGNDLWITDGNAASTLEVSGNALAGTNARTRQLLPTSGQALLLGFDADGSGATEPFAASGVAGGTVALGNLSSDIGDSHPRPIGVVGDRLVLSARTAAGSASLFSLSTTRAEPPLSLEAASTASGGVRFGRLWLRAFDGLKATDGSAAPMRLLTPARPEMFLADCVVMRAGLAHVLAIDPSDDTVQVFRSDGSVAGTGRATQLPNQEGIGLVDLCGRDLRAIAGMGDSIFVVGVLPSTVAAGMELLRLDAANQLSLVIDLRTGSDSGDIRDMLALDNRLLFVGNDGIFGEELWATNGTAQGTVRLTDLNPGAGGSSISRLTRVGARAYFVATTPGLGSELYVTDGTPAGTALVADLFAGSGSGMSAANTRLVAVGDTLFFTALRSSDPACRLFRTEGTSTSTRCAYAASAAALGPVRELVAGASGALVFTAAAAADGDELRVLRDGQLLSLPALDLRPGPLGSAAAELLASGDRVFFQANDGSTGFEPWQLDLSSLDRVFVDGFESGVNQAR